jgi:transposase
MQSPLLICHGCLYNPVIRFFCERFKVKGKNGKIIICAAMPKLIHLIFSILKSRVPFDADFTSKRLLN